MVNLPHAAAQDWLAPPYLEPPRRGLGLAPIGLENWLSPDDQAHRLDEKRALLKSTPEEVCAQLPESAPALAELADILRAAGFSPASDNIADIAACFSDDPVILLPNEDGTWVVKAVSLCAPTFFSVADCINRALGPIHAPVPDKNSNRADRIARIFTALPPDQILERFNWTLQWGNRAHTPDGRPLREMAQAAPTSAAFENIHERVERQTIRKLPKTGAILFTIRVRLAPLSARLTNPIWREAFWRAFDGLGEDMMAYKKLAILAPHMAHLRALYGPKS